jgi:hypothetical protein
MPGAGLSDGLGGKALSDMPAFQPYWGKPAVRNDRGAVETSASFEARYAPLSYPTAGGDQRWSSLPQHAVESAMPAVRQSRLNLIDIPTPQLSNAATHRPRSPQES